MESEKKSSSNILTYIVIFATAIIVTVLGMFLIINFMSVRNVSRTVMIYMVGSDLESGNGLASDELEGLPNYNRLVENGMNVVMIAGGSKKWSNNYISTEETSIFEFRNGGFEKIKQQPVRNMGDASVLADFINFVTTNYKTDEYDLIFWNHGGAIQGSEYDELHRNDNLSLTEMRDALDDTIFAKGKKLEAVIFSTCLNGSLEMSNLYKKYARYLVGSEEVSISYQGASDFSFLEKVTPHDDGDVFGQKFVEQYQEKTTNLRQLYASYAMEYDVYSTYAVVDLSKIDDLNSALEEFFGSIDVQLNYNQIARERANLYQYALDSSDTPHYDMVDLYNLVEALQPYSKGSKERVTNAIEAAVTYNYATNDQSRGISIYFPYNGSKTAKEMFLDIYPQITPSENYNKFIKDFYKAQSVGASGKGIDLESNKLSVENVKESEADFSAELTDEQVANFARARYVVFRNNPDYPGYYYPTLIGKEVELDGNTLRANVKGHQLSIYDSDEGGYQTIFANESEVNDDYITYDFQVILEDFRPEEIKDWRFDRANITLTQDRSTGQVGITSVRLVDDTDKTETERRASGSFVRVTDYQYIAFVAGNYNVINDDMTYNPDFESNEVVQGWEVETEDLQIALQDNFDDGYDYYCAFQVWDVYNNLSYSKFVKL